jgi:hypothetical protein
MFLSGLISRNLTKLRWWVPRNSTGHFVVTCRTAYVLFPFKTTAVKTIVRPRVFIAIPLSAILLMCHA